MFCRNCGSEQRDGVKFCTNCGASLEELQQEPAQTQQDSSQTSDLAQPQQEPVQSDYYQQDAYQYQQDAYQYQQDAYQYQQSYYQPAPNQEAIDTIYIDQDGQNYQFIPGDAAPPKSGRGLVAVAVILIVFAIVSVVGVAGALTNGFGLLTPAEEAPEPSEELESDSDPETDSEQDPDPEPETEPAPEVRSNVAEYSWEELSQISELISAAGDETEAREIAIEYHLCNSDGTLDGTQTKQLKLSNGTTVTMQVLGFYHDEREDGGMAGITFGSRGIVGKCAMNKADTTVGGWRDSDLRAWMNSDLLDMLPSEVASQIVPVIKYTNAAGETTDPTSVVATTDTLWAPAYAELGGHMYLPDEKHDEVFNAEGEQYQLYADMRATWDAPNDILAIDGVERWWERSPDPMDARYSMAVGSDGIPWYGNTPKNVYGVVMCFCI